MKGIYTKMIDKIKEKNANIEEKYGPTKTDRGADFKNVIASISPNRALNLGAGDGNDEIRKTVKKDGKVVSFDPDFNALKQNSADRKVCGVGEDLPFKDNMFDLVFSKYVFEHLPHPGVTLDEISRVTKPNGHIVIQCPNPRHYFARISEVLPFWAHKIVLLLQGERDPNHEAFPTVYRWGELSDLLKTADNQGWIIKELNSYPGPTSYTSILPIHAAFVGFERFLENYPTHHVAFVVHYKTPSAALSS